MRKFIIHQSRDKVTSIMEVEIELVTATEDPSIMWLPFGEYKARVLKPVSLYEKDQQGHTVAPIWHSHSFYWNEYQAMVVAEKGIRDGFERDLRKLGIAYTEQQISEKLSEIKVIKLS